MKAQVINQFGDPFVFEYSNIARPILKPGHVLIRVYATSVNPIDCKIRSGVVAEVSPDFPAILHGDVSGVIEEIADDIADFEIGDEIYGFAGGLKGTNGALAEYMLVDAKLIAKKPKSLSLLECAALPLASITAWEALFNKAKLTNNQHILVHGGVGGVGHVAVQLARWCEANVSTTVLKNEDFSLAKSLGASEIINAKEENVEKYVLRLTNNQGFDVVFDTVGGLNLSNSLIAAKTNGSVVTTNARSTQDLTPVHHKALSLHAVFTLLPILKNEGREIYGKILAKIAEIVDEGKLKVLIDQNKFTLDSISEAHHFLESGKAQGKVLVSIA